MCRWLYKELGPETPLHFSRFYPRYKLKKAYTPSLTPKGFTIQISGWRDGVVGRDA